ncbi:MAG: hypothetical protein HYT27_03525 [Parcubacteria group bacterium]|nr:hypothetical protein [Parcubacteria group bacterium]
MSIDAATIKDVFVWLVVITMLMFTCVYGRLIYKKKIEPALSSWLIWMLATGLSLITYTIAENDDLKTGIFNTADFMSIVVIVSIILEWGNRSMFKKTFSWQKYYLVGASLIIIYGLTTGDAWKSNILTQALIALGYCPTIHNMFVQKRNTESFAAWGLLLAAALLAFVPALIDGNTLAALYVFRAAVMIGIILAVMGYYEKKTKNVLPVQ